MKKTLFSGKALLATVCLGSVLLPAGVALGENEKTTTEKETVVVTATRTESLVEDTSAAVDVITRQDIEAKGAIRLRDILRFSNGLYYPEDDSVSIRGMNPNQSLFLIDGRRITGEVSGNFEIDRLPVNNIKQIEIVRGPVSALYGTDALGGIINIITDKPERLKFNINPQYGFHTEDSDGDQKSIRVGADVPINDKLAISLTGAWRDYGRLNNSLGESVQKDGNDQTVGLNLFYDLTATDSIILRGDYLREEYDNFIRRGMIKTTDDNQRQNYSLGWRHDGQTLQGLIRVYTSLYDKDFEVRKNMNSKLIQFIAAKRSTSVLEAQGTTALGNNKLTGGAEIRRETFRGNVLNTGDGKYSIRREGVSYIGSEVEIDYYAAYLQDEVLLGDAFSITGSIRYDDSDYFSSEFSPKIGIVYRAVEGEEQNLRLKANYGHGFKTPTPADLYLETVNAAKKIKIVPNENIGSETSDSYDISLEGKYRGFFGKISYFQNDVEDLIDKVFTGRMDPRTGFKIFRSENIKTADIKGLEAELAYHFTADKGIRMTYMYLDAEGDLLVGPPQMKKYQKMSLEQRPEHRVVLNGWYSYAPLGLQFDVRGEYTGNMLLNYTRGKMNSIAGENSKSYWLWYLSVTKDFGKNLQWYAGVDNIFNKTDDEVPLNGAFVYTGIRMNF